MPIAVQIQGTSAFAVQAEVEIAGRGHVGRIGVELGEDLAGQQEHVDDHRHLHDPPQRQQRVVADLVLREAPHDLQRQNDEGRARGERAGQEPRGDDRRVPERPAAQAHVQKGRDRVDADRPDDGDEDERHVEHRDGLRPQ